MHDSASEQKDSHTLVLPGINKRTKEFRHSGTPECMNQQVNKRIHPHSGAPGCMTQRVNKIHESASEQKDSPTLWSTRMHDSTTEQNT